VTTVHDDPSRIHLSFFLREWNEPKYHVTDAIEVDGFIQTVRFAPIAIDVRLLFDVPEDGESSPNASCFPTAEDDSDLLYWIDHYLLTHLSDEITKQVATKDFRVLFQTMQGSGDLHQTTVLKDQFVGCYDGRKVTKLQPELPDLEECLFRIIMLVPSSHKKQASLCSLSADEKLTLTQLLCEMHVMNQFSIHCSAVSLEYEYSSDDYHDILPLRSSTRRAFLSPLWPLSQFDEGKQWDVIPVVEEGTDVTIVRHAFRTDAGSTVTISVVAMATTEAVRRTELQMFLVLSVNGMAFKRTNSIADIGPWLADKTAFEACQLELPRAIVPNTEREETVVYDVWTECGTKRQCAFVADTFRNPWRNQRVRLHISVECDDVESLDDAACQVLLTDAQVSAAVQSAFAFALVQAFDSLVWAHDEMMDAEANVDVQLRAATYRPAHLLPASMNETVDPAIRPVKQIANAVCSIIRRSQNLEFQERCLELIGVSAESAVDEEHLLEEMQQCVRGRIVDLVLREREAKHKPKQRSSNKRPRSQQSSEPTAADAPNSADAQ
jgi:hypothetical protein